MAKPPSLSILEAARVLGVQPDAGAAVVRAAYRALAAEYHPDRNPDPQAPLRMLQVNLAYDRLSVLSAEARAYQAEQEAVGARHPEARLSGPPVVAHPDEMPSAVSGPRRSGWGVRLLLAVHQGLLPFWRLLGRLLAALTLLAAWAATGWLLYRQWGWIAPAAAGALTFRILRKTLIRLIRFGWHDALTYLYHLSA
ncbi:DnaJ domain-containing protein [Thiomonas sp.]